MKRGFVAIILICFFLSLFGCHSAERTPVDQTDTGSEGEQMREKSSVPPDERQTFCFAGYSELTKWIYAKENAERDNGAFGEDYADYIAELTDPSKSVGLYVPYCDGAPAELRNEEGFSGVVLMTSELYNIPWVWYYTVVDGRELTVKCACLSEKDLVRIDTESASNAVRNFSRSAPNIDNYETNENYKRVSEIEIVFSGESVSALCLESSRSTKINLQFVFDNTMVIVTGSTDVINSGVLARFSLHKTSTPES